MVGHVKTPKMNGIATKAEVLQGIRCRTRLDDDGRAVSASAQMLGTGSMQDILNDGRVEGIGFKFGWHRASAAEQPDGGHFATYRYARSSETGGIRVGSNV